MSNGGNRIVRLFLLLTQSLTAVSVVHGLANYAIPTELGQDAICWESTEEGGGTLLKIKNPLLEDFTFGDRVDLLNSCPEGNALSASAPSELLQGEKMRTLRYYNFTVSGSLNLTSLHPQAPTLVSDQGPVVAVQIVACEIGRAGFCSPFIHEEAIARANARFQARANNSTDSSSGGSTRRRRRFQEGDRHGGTHVHSKYQYVELPPEEGPSYNFTIQVPFIVNLPGNFFTIADVQLHLGNNETGVQRYDIANALVDDQRLISFQAPADILEVPDVVRIISYVCIGIVTAIIAFLLVQTVRHRNHQVFQLTQGNFLVVFLFAALTATVASFLLEPRNDAYCRAALPLIMCSAQLLYAVTLGRLWRINAVISPLLVRTLRQQTSWTHRCAQLLRSKLRVSPHQSKKLHRECAARQLAIIIATFTAPQLAIQLLGIFLQPARRDVDYNNDESQGRAYCNCGTHVGNRIAFYGYICFGLLIVLLLATAHNARALPSLLNETHDIFSSTLASLVIFVLGGGIVAVANSPTTSPAIQYLVSVALTLSLTLNTSVRIMVPKLRMVWNGETVLVSKLVSDHRESIQKKNDTFIRVSNQLDSSALQSSHSFRAHLGSSTFSSGHDDSEEFNCHSTAVPATNPETITEQATRKTKCHRRAAIVVKRDVAPDRRLVIKLVNLQSTLARVNERIMSGMAVSEEDWASLRLMSSTLGSTFKNEVEFAWERMREQAPELNVLSDGEEVQVKPPSDSNDGRPKTIFSKLLQFASVRKLVEEEKGKVGDRVEV